MATIKNIDYYRHMRDYNLKQLECAKSTENIEYYSMCANHWQKKIDMVSPKSDVKIINRTFVVWK